MKKVVCGYKQNMGFGSITTLSFDRVYDEVKLKMFDIMQFFQIPIVQTLPDTFYDFSCKKFNSVFISGSEYQQECSSNNSNLKTLQINSSSREGTLWQNGYFKAGVAGLYIANCSSADFFCICSSNI